ncbi:MAG: L-arabinose isomerase, partial [Anaerolineae bacterium]|nr:L-arabinose isomerase [Anaerolineae bacterium]
MKIDLCQFEIWFVTGSQHLYGPEALEQVGQHSQEIAAALDASSAIPTRVVYKPVVTTPEDIYETLQAANMDPKCVG